MAGELNKVIMSGRLVVDPELKQTTTGISVCENRLAVRRSFVKDGGQDTDFINIVVMRHSADFLCRYFRKGDRVLVVGEYRNDEYKDKDGNRKYSPKIEVKEIYSIKEPAKASDGETVQTDYAKNDLPSFEQLRQDDDLPF